MAETTEEQKNENKVEETNTEVDLSGKSLDDIISAEQKTRQNNRKRRGKKRRHPNAQNVPMPPPNGNFLKLINEVSQKLQLKIEFSPVEQSKDINNGFKYQLTVTFPSATPEEDAKADVLTVEGFGKSKKQSRANAAFNALSSDKIKNLLMQIPRTSKKWKSLMMSGMEPILMGGMGPGPMFHGPPPSWGYGFGMGMPPGPAHLFPPYGMPQWGPPGFHYAPQPIFQKNKKRRKNKNKTVQPAAVGEVKSEVPEQKAEEAEMAVEN